MAIGALDANGIWIYGEDDPASPASDLLNLGQESTSDAVGDAKARLTALEAPPAAWVNPALGNSWVTPGAMGSLYQIAAYRLDAGQVQLRGMIGAGTLSTPIFTLPAGFRPALREMFSCVANGGSAQVEVRPDGMVIVIAYASGSTNTLVSLAGIRFEPAS